MQVEDLIGTFVVEIGVRQAWPFLGLADNRPLKAVELRLYLDTDWSFGEGQTGRTDREAELVDWVKMALDLDGLTVEDAQKAESGELTLRFTDGHALTVNGMARYDTVGEPWWIADRWQDTMDD